MYTVLINDIILVKFEGVSYICKVVINTYNVCEAVVIQDEKHPEIVLNKRVPVTSENSTFISREHPTKCQLTKIKTH